MCLKVNGTIEELKAIVTDLHRTAAQLDEIIQQMEIEEKSIVTAEYHQMFVRSEFSYRKDFKRARGYSDLEERENLIWQKLLENLKKEES